MVPFIWVRAITAVRVNTDTAVQARASITRMRDFTSISFIEWRAVTLRMTIIYSTVSAMQTRAWMTHVTFTVTSSVSQSAGTVISKAILVASSRIKARVNITLLRFCTQSSLERWRTYTNVVVIAYLLTSRTILARIWVTFIDRITLLTFEPFLADAGKFLFCI